MPGASSKSPSILFAFDFDKTIVDLDADLELTKILPLPTEIQGLCDGYFWTDYVNAVFKHLHQNGISLTEISKVIQGLPLVNGMTELFSKIFEEILPSSENGHFVMISDANDFNINLVLNKINPDFKPNALLTNMTTVTKEGLLEIHPYHSSPQTFCSICPKNFCKGFALQKYILENGPFDKVVYVGDGKNDICPVTKLEAKDTVFARKGYVLQEIIQSGVTPRGHHVQVQAKVNLWSDAFDIINQI